MGKAFTIKNNNIEAIRERIENIKLCIYNKINTNIDALDMPFAYGMDEFLGTYLAYDNNGFTKQFTSDDFINNSSKIIEWRELGWFLNTTLDLWNTYPFVSIASKYIYCKFYDIMKDMNVIQFYFICDRIKINDIYIQNDYIRQALSILPSIFNIIQYVSLNGLNDLVSGFYLEDMYDCETETKRNEYINLIESKKQTCDFYKSINFGSLRKMMYKYNDSVKNKDCNLYNLGYGWQDKMFRESSEYFDSVQRIYNVNIKDINIKDMNKQENIYFKQEKLTLDYNLLNNIYTVIINENNLIKDNTLRNNIIQSLKNKKIELLYFMNDKNMNDKNMNDKKLNELYNNKIKDYDSKLLNTKINLNIIKKLFNELNFDFSILLDKDIAKKINEYINRNKTNYYSNNYLEQDNEIKISNNIKNMDIFKIIDILNKKINKNYLIEPDINNKYFIKYLKYKNKYLKLKSSK